MPIHESNETKVRKLRKRRGYALIEMPVALWLLFIALFFPLAIIASLGYRATLCSYGVEQACRKAAKAPTFTDAQTRGTKALNDFVAGFSGISIAANTVGILQKPLGGGAPKYFSAKLAPGSVDTSKDIFFLVLDVDTDLDPLVRFGSWMGMSVPGLTGPYRIRVRQQAYVENPTGLTE